LERLRALQPARRADRQGIVRRRYGLTSAQYNGLLTLDGRVITHHSREQLEWLHPGARVVEVPGDIPASQCMPLWEHPDYPGAFDANGDVIRSRFREPR
jgi:hypothetical protein